ncbi:MAG: M91 family zinc metallopeptidase [Firmicutes bacterium]|nr:M91 family zinc metallopeptidase [Bacillota bacterium]
MITGLSEYSEEPTGGSVTQYSYNSNLGYLSKVTDPMGVIETYYDYDYAGNLTKWSDRNGNMVYNEYGPYGLTKTYFSSTEAKEYTYNSIGQLTGTSSVNSDGTEVTNSYTYDAFGRMISSTSDDGSVQNYTYDDNSNVTAYELIKDDVTENSISYEYNNLNRLTELTNNGIITSYTYDANGNLTEKSDDNGITSSYTYNAANLVTKMSTKNGSTTYQGYSISYYLDGLKNTESDSVNSCNRIYTYYKTGELKEELIYGSSGDIMDSYYEYDASRNRTLAEITNEDKSVTIENYTYDANNRLTGIAESYKSTPSGTATATGETKYYYDDNGNTIAKQVTKYTSGTETSEMGISGRSPDSGMEIFGYDKFNRLTNYNSGANEATYTYDADNLRASKTVDREKTTFVWNGSNLANETTDSAVNTYTYDATGVYIANQNGTVTSYLKDMHGNIAAKADSSGAKLEESYMNYDAYGNQWQGNTPDPFGYCGEYYDEESGLIYLRNRYYESETGRFITEDPAQDGTNWYSYCAGNPVVLVDPSGLAFTLPNYNSNGDERLQALQALTDDTLDYDINNGLVIITNRVSDPDREKGTSLIRELVDNSIICTIDYTLDNDAYTNTTYDNNDNITYIEILYNPNVNHDILVDTPTGTEISQQNGYMAMAHELCHVYRRFSGNRYDLTNPKGSYIDSKGDVYLAGTCYYQYNGVNEVQLHKREELATTGILYYESWYDDNGKEWINSAWPGVYTENAIRAENGLYERVRY